METKTELEQLIKAAKKEFDNRFKAHPVEIRSGDLTSVHRTVSADPNDVKEFLVSKLWEAYELGWQCCIEAEVASD